MKKIFHSLWFFLVCFLVVPVNFDNLRVVSPVLAVSCIRSDTGTTTLNTTCTLDGIPKYDANGTEISRTGIINSGDLNISGVDVTVQPNTTIVWPIGKAITVQSGGRIILGSGASLTQAEPITYQFQNLGFTVNAAGDPVKVVNNVLQVCTNTTCSIAAPSGTGHAVVEGQLKVGTTFIIDGSGNVGVGTTAPGAKLHISGGSLLIDNNSSIQFKNAAGTAVAGLMVNDSNQTVLFSAGWGMTFLNVAQSAQLMTILDSGNVGIGSTSPGAKLDVAGNINSSTGALQTAGVTRIDNSGVGAFAAGTTIGGAAVGGIPTGMIAFFASSCPSGWTEYTTSRGMYIVGNPSGGTLATGVGTALTNLENRPVGQHNHGITDPGHNHNISQIMNYNVNGPYYWYPFSDYRPDGTGGTMWATASKTTSITINNSGSVAGTNAPYIQLTACQKS